MTSPIPPTDSLLPPQSPASLSPQPSPPNLAASSPNPSPLSSPNPWPNQHPNPYSLPSAFSPSTSSLSSAASADESTISRQSSCRSTASVHAVPIRKADRAPAVPPPTHLVRAYSGIPISKTHTNHSLASSHGSGIATGSGTNPSLPRPTPVRQGSSGLAPLTPAIPPPALAGSGPLHSGLTNWSHVGASVGDVARSLPSPSAVDPNATIRAPPATARPGIDTRSSTSTSTSVSASASTSTDAALRKTVGDFTFGDPLGEGSYSTVTLVTDKSPPFRQYALKVLDKEHIKREKKTKYVLIERDTLKALDGHPGIVRLYWTFQDLHSLYYVLELASNGELLKWIKKFGSFSLPSARFYAAQILSAVEHIHSHGIIHRDLKPENILLDHNMRVKVTDFGTAKQLNPDTGDATPHASPAEGGPPGSGRPKARPRSFVGTPEYVSPEILSEGRESSRASDFWGFGCILFQMIAGRPPFQAKTEYLMFQKIIKLEYEFPLGFPGPARDLVERLLVLDPSERLGSGERGVEEIKRHQFFAEDGSIDFSAVWTTTPPPIETGLTPPRPVQRGEFVLLDTDTLDGPDHDPGSEDDLNSPIDPNEQHYPTSHNPLGGPEEATKWTGLLGPTETILFASSVQVRRGFRTRPRELLLTDAPRLLCIKEMRESVTLKSEVLMGHGAGDGERFVKAALESDKIFTVKTTLGRSYKYEEPSGSAARWVAELTELNNALLAQGQTQS